MGTQFFIDETKAKGYVVVTVACPDPSLAFARRALGKLVLPGQRSIHMKHEGARRRRQIAHTVCNLHKIGVRAVVLDAGRGPDPEHIRRERALHAIVQLAAEIDAAHLVVDLDQTLMVRDARTLSTAIRHAHRESITYSHQTLAAQPLLALPDVIAWCWARGGDWRRRVTPIITETIKV